MKNNKNSKVRVRTKLELVERKKNFLKITDILKKKKIIFFLQGGVLLGARREKNFIKWDWDIEISLFSDDLIKNFEILVKELRKCGYKIINQNQTNYTPKIAFMKKNDKSTFYSFIGWKYNSFNKSYTRKKFKIPEHFLKKFTKIKFLNKDFNCPSPIDEYLKHHYGNWKTPLISDNKKEYLNSRFYTRSDDVFYYINSLLTYLKKIFI